MSGNTHGARERRGEDGGRTVGDRGGGENLEGERGQVMNGK